MYQQIDESLNVENINIKEVRIYLISIGFAVTLLTLKALSVT